MDKFTPRDLEKENKIIFIWIKCTDFPSRVSQLVRERDEREREREERERERERERKGRGGGREVREGNGVSVRQNKRK